MEMVAQEKEGNRFTDLSYLRAIAKGSNEFVLKLINSFITQTTEEIKKMKTSLQKQDWEGIHSTAHKIKPSLHFVGITDLKEPIVELEELAKKKQDPAHIGELVNQVADICTIAIKELEEEAGKLKK
jgi:HPt (histidine-containing phosphotransfer) domain-containing protein